MLTQYLEYKLENKYIAQKQIKNYKKLLVFIKNKKTIIHSMFNNIYKFFNINDILILNNTYVESRKIFCKTSDGKFIEIFIEKILNDFESIAMIKNIKIYKFLYIKNIKLFIEKYNKNLFKINTRKIPIKNIIRNFGNIPLPPYIKSVSKNNDYQTVYGLKHGSIAAHTAGLNFNKELLNKIKKRGVKIYYITLHIGSGTFLPIKNINKHKMHLEYISINKNTYMNILKHKKNGKNIIACGTTVVRALETIGKSNKKNFNGETNLFIKPGFKFKIINSIITNFHLPKSTLIVLISSFIGVDKVLKIYNEAIKYNYRFYSYGDSMFIK
jgi:S-adenosylmethionine:tRNA ribosyltransferase-isomerase